MVRVDYRHDAQRSFPFIAFNAVVTCEIILFQNYFSLRRCPTEIRARANLPEIF